MVVSVFFLVFFSSTFGTKKQPYVFFSVGDPSVFCVGSGSQWTSSGHRPDPDALDLDEIVEDMLLEEEAEAWRGCWARRSMMRFGWRFGAIFFLLEDIFVWNNGSCKIWYLYIMFTFIVSGL